MEATKVMDMNGRKMLAFYQFTQKSTERREGRRGRHDKEGKGI